MDHDHHDQALGMKPATELDPGIHSSCGKPVQLPAHVFRDWWFTPRSERFVPLRELLAPYCVCSSERQSRL